MTCNLLNNKAALIEAFDKVSDSNSRKHWCIFEYDSDSNIVKVGGTGENGLTELIEQFDSRKIQYGFASTQDKTRKIFMIHWQGDGVSVIRRSQTASHVNDIRRFVRSVHLTIYARNDEDIEIAVILSQLAKIGSAVDDPPKSVAVNGPSALCTPVDLNQNRQLLDSSAQDHHQDCSQLAKPSTLMNEVPSKGMQAMQKPIPAPKSMPWVPPLPKPVAAMPMESSRKPSASIDIDFDERATFWKEMRAEEEARRRGETLKLEEQRRVFAEERRCLEMQLHQTHLAKMAEQQAVTIQNPPLAQLHKKSSPLIAGRTQLFEQKMAELASTIPKPMKKPKTFKFEVGLVNPNAPVINASNSESTAEANGEGVDEEPKLNVRIMLRQLNSGCFDAKPQIPVQSVQPVLKEAQDKTDTYQTEMDVTKHNNSVNDTGGKSTKTVHAVRTLWDYQAEDQTEITFEPGEVIDEVEMVYDGWWRGRAPNGQIGLFPSNYVELL